jgi:hypothetical protein
VELRRTPNRLLLNAVLESADTPKYARGADDRDE